MSSFLTIHSDYNPCVNNPCRNNGRCVQTQSQTFKCLCPSYTTGKRCETGE